MILFILPCPWLTRHAKGFRPSFPHELVMFYLFSIMPSCAEVVRGDVKPWGREKELSSNDISLDDL